MARHLHELPKLKDSLSFLYLEQCRIEQDSLGIAAWDLEGITQIPVASLNSLLLGPGTVVTHAAMRAIAENGCNVVWVGENGVRTYASGTGETRSARNVLRQAYLATREPLRLQVVARMYRMRFPEPLPAGLTLQQIRGREGARVRDAYFEASRASKVPWDGRAYDRNNWDNATPINKALSAANACLYGVVHAAIVALGYSPALGFIHSGKQLSFVYDIADLYKVELAVPAAFESVAEDREQHLHPPPPSERMELEIRTRRRLRDLIVTKRLLERIPRDIAHALNVPTEGYEDDPWADDPAAPARLWTPKEGDSVTLPAAGPDERGDMKP